MISTFKVLLAYYPQMSYKDNYDPKSQSQTADKNVAELCNLMKKLKVNPAES